jgi:DNA modification methylase
MRIETIGNATLYLGDCREVLPTLAPVDCVITDPPYSAITHSGARGKGATTGGAHVLLDFQHLDDSEWISIVGSAIEKARRWSVVFSDFDLSKHARALSVPLIRAGVWVKNDPAPQFTGDWPGTGWEHVLVFHPEGVKKWNGGGRPAIWRTNIEKNGNVHPTQKPVALMEMLLADFTNYGETVLDPFAGSGTTGVAAVKMGRTFTGVEREQKYFDIACKRIEDAQRQTSMFEQPAMKAEQHAFAL